MSDKLMMANAINSYNRWKTLQIIIVFLALALVGGAGVFFYIRYHEKFIRYKPNSNNDELEEKFNMIKQRLDNRLNQHEDKLHQIHHQLNF